MKTAHPSECTGCRHSMRYATIIEGKVIHDGIGLRMRVPFGRSGCRHFAEVAAKEPKRKR